jgi:chromosome segregation protein
MFKLQRLEITGFKSFADHTEIIFTGNGITAVVGPNGCGKSNVSDAISWVLGEQRAKSLRGGEMKDVVFQGSRNRKPGGMAEVILHLVRDDEVFDIDEQELEDIDEALSSFDENAVDIDEIEGIEPEPAEIGAAAGVNGFHEQEYETVQAAQVGSIRTVERTVRTKRHWKPRSAALEFAPGESVSVARRLFLSGESEYELNGKTCRLRDIQDLFAGTGLSGAHYAIVEQGRIGQILSAKPSDRRSLIEEAAGISKFRTRQRAAESRLESAKANLSRISDIVTEIDKQAGSLRRQAAKTRRFIALQEAYRERVRSVFAAEGRRYSRSIEDLRAMHDAAVKTENELAEKVRQGEEHFRDETARARTADELLADVRQRHSQNALERDRAEREHRYRSEQIVSLNERAEALRREIDAISQRMQLAAAESERLANDEKAEAAALEASQAVLTAAEGLYSEKLNVLENLEAQLDERRDAVLRHTAALERLDELRRQLGNNLERLEEQGAGLARERMRAEESLEHHRADAQKLAAELTAEQSKLRSLTDEKTGLLERSAEAREKLRASEEALRALQDEFTRQNNRLETLRELEEKKAVYAPQVQQLFAAADEIGVELGGVLADRLNVEEEAERAVEGLFGPFLQAVLVNSAEDAVKVSEWAARRGMGRVATLVLGGANSGGTRPSAGSIAQMLGAGDDVIAILEDVFPREIEAALVDEIQLSEAARHETQVTREGSISYGARMFVGGTHSAEGPNESLLAFKRELVTLDKTVTRLEREIEKAVAAAEGDRKALAEIEEKTVDLQSLIIKIERGLMGIEVNERSARQEIERAERHRTVVEAEIRRSSSDADELHQRIADAGLKAEEAGRQLAAAQGEMERIAGLLREARSETEAANASLNQKRTVAATAAERRRSVAAALRRLENETAELGTQLRSRQTELQENEARVEELRSAVLEIAGRITSAEHDLARETEELEEAIAVVQRARASADQASEALADLNRRAADAMNERASIDIRHTEAVTELKNLGERSVQELGMQLAELVSTEPEDDTMDLDAARAEVDEQRRRLDSFGAINMLAVEELAETEERLEFVSSQRRDIVDSIASAEEALREIKQRSRERFRHAFEVINENFVQYFQELFGGGRGEMSLLEADDILEAGIEIVAQPPGKRLQNILLLSGGEKAMTAIALVLSIFKFRPSPFCLLDEVDAPLDDANVGRFVDKIADMSEKTQFIVITHNKRTMEAARALYGVTMQEAGVSKVVSVKFD